LFGNAADLPSKGDQLPKNYQGVRGDLPRKLINHTKRMPRTPRGSPINVKKRAYQKNSLRGKTPSSAEKRPTYHSTTRKRKRGSGKEREERKAERGPPLNEGRKNGFAPKPRNNRKTKVRGNRKKERPERTEEKVPIRKRVIKKKHTSPHTRPSYFKKKKKPRHLVGVRPKSQKKKLEK